MKSRPLVPSIPIANLNDRTPPATIEETLNRRFYNRMASLHSLHWHVSVPLLLFIAHIPLQHLLNAT